MFPGIECSGTIACRMKQVRDNHIVSGLCHSYEPPCVSDVQFELRIASRLLVERLELVKDLNNLGNQFDPVRLQIPMFAKGAQRNARSDSEEKCASRIGMQQQRDVGVTTLGVNRAGAAHVKTVINLETAVPIEMLDHRDRIHHALAIFQELAA